MHHAEDDALVIVRGEILCAVNRGESRKIELPSGTWKDFFSGNFVQESVLLQKNGFLWLKKQATPRREKQ